jgi:hypothetical protein
MRDILAALLICAIAAPQAAVAQAPDNIQPPQPEPPPILVQPHAMTTPAPPDCRLEKRDSFDLKVTPEAISTSVSLNGVTKTLNLALPDTENVLTDDTVSELGLSPRTPPPPQLVVQYGKISLTRRVQVTDVRLGNTVIKGADFWVGSKRLYPEGAAGQLGKLAFWPMDLDLDFAHGKLNLFNPDHCPGNVVYWTAQANAATIPFSNLPYGPMATTMMLDGVKLTVRLAMPGPSMIGMNFVRGVFGLETDSPGMTKVKAEDIGLSLSETGGRSIYSYPFKTLSVGGLTINHPAIYIYDQDHNNVRCDSKTYRDAYVKDRFDLLLAAKCYGDKDLSLGLSTLSKLHIYASTKENLLYITPADAH